MLDHKTISGLSYRPLTQKDLEWARQLHNDPEVLVMLTDPRKVSEDQQKAWFKSLQKSLTSERILVSMKDIPIGLIRIDQLDFVNNSVCLGLDIVKTHRGQGLAPGIYKTAMNVLFNSKDLRMHRVWLLVAEYNMRARRLYKKLGFSQEGVLKDAIFRNGEYHNYISMSILKDEYEAQP